MSNRWEPDSGLAAERTALAWRRTALSALSASALFGHYAATTATVMATAGGIAALISMGVVTGACYRRAGALRARRPDRTARVKAIVSGALALSGVVIAIGLAH
ncbi:DUF202 domain-containing protein [Nocardia tengchongensis]|uniref:DUF202 domain-containing protein n=1 Tax=Nocardia tengchongensis TaxID=2055889 RepID=UPI00368F1815